MKLKKYDLDHFRRHPKSVRIHRPHNIELLCNSLRQFGQVFPMASLPDGTILKGHGLLLAARVTHTTPLWTIEIDADPEQAEAFMMLENRIAETGEWDMAGVIDLLKRLGPNHPMTPCLGWTHEELEVLFLSEFQPKQDLEQPHMERGQGSLLENCENEYVWTELYTD